MESALALVAPHGAGTNLRGRVGAGWRPDLNADVVIQDPAAEPASVLPDRSLHAQALVASRRWGGGRRRFRAVARRGHVRRGD
jgi:hypothetical protein